MTALSDMRTVVRRDLHDEDPAAYRYTDNSVDRAIALALAEYNKVKPYTTKQDLATVADSYDIDIDTLLSPVEIYAIEFPIGNRPATYQPFMRATLSGDKSLRMLGSKIGDGTNARIWYGREHLTSGTWTIDAADEFIIAIGATAYAYESYVGFTSTPVAGTDVAQFLPSGDIRAQAARLKAEFRKHLNRLRRIRTARLFTPAEPFRSQTTDWGP